MAKPSTVQNRVGVSSFPPGFSAARGLFSEPVQLTRLQLLSRTAGSNRSTLRKRKQRRRGGLLPCKLHPAALQGSCRGRMAASIQLPPTHPPSHAPLRQAFPSHREQVYMQG